MDFIAKPSLLVDSVIFLDCTAADKLARSSLWKKILYTWMASYSASKKEAIEQLGIVRGGPRTYRNNLDGYSPIQKVQI